MTHARTRKPPGPPVKTPAQIQDEAERRERAYARLDARIAELRAFFIEKGVALPPPEHAHRSRLGREALRVGAYDEAWTIEARRLEAERLARLGQS